MEEAGADTEIRAFIGDAGASLRERWAQWTDPGTDPARENGRRSIDMRPFPDVVPWPEVQAA